MSETPTGSGFTARLLGRAEGQVTALRPQIANLFAAEGGNTAPLLERTEEMVTAPPPGPTAMVPETQHAQTRVSVEMADPVTLMPRQPSEPAHTQFVPLVAQASDQGEQVGSITTQSPPQPAPAQEPPAQFAASTETSAQPPRAEHSSDSLLAAVTQLLGPQFQTELASAAPQREDASPADRFAATAAQGTDPSAPASQQQPLQIHIGELVIAPEPREPQPEALAPAQWQPPLSLDAYRASRTRAQS